jgi:hypothetical protein
LPWLVAAIIGAGLGIRFGNGVRTPVVLVLIVAMFVTLFAAFLQ